MKGKYTMKAKTVMNAALIAALASFLGAADAEAVRGTACNAPIERLAADFDYFGQFVESSTQSEASAVVGFGNVPQLSRADNLGDGLRIYDKTVFVPTGKNTAYVTMSTTGDSHGGAGSCFSCVITDPAGTRTFCNPGGQGAARCALDGNLNVPGWISLLKLPEPTASTNCNDGAGGTADCHDNSIHYEWCVPVEAGTHRVELWMATSHDNETVFIEQAHFYIDASCIRGQNRCTQAPTPGEDSLP